MRIDRESLAVLLVRKGVTAKRVAELAGISYTSIYNVKKGMQCSDSMGEKIAAALGVPVEAIVAKEG